MIAASDAPLPLPIGSWGLPSWASHASTRARTIQLFGSVRVPGKRHDPRQLEVELRVGIAHLLQRREQLCLDLVGAGIGRNSHVDIQLGARRNERGTVGRPGSDRVDRALGSHQAGAVVRCELGQPLLESLDDASGRHDRVPIRTLVPDPRVIHRSAKRDAEPAVADFFVRYRVARLENDREIGSLFLGDQLPDASPVTDVSTQARPRRDGHAAATQGQDDLTAQIGIAPRDRLEGGDGRGGEALRVLRTQADDLAVRAARRQCEIGPWHITQPRLIFVARPGERRVQRGIQPQPRTILSSSDPRHEAGAALPEHADARLGAETSQPLGEPIRQQRIPRRWGSASRSSRSRDRRAGWATKSNEHAR